LAEWCTITEVQFWMSEEGVEVATNDDQTQTTPDLTIVNPAIIQARLWLSQYLVQKYDISLITSANEWVKWSTAVAASVILLRRKGGVVSAGLQEAYEALTAFLEGVQSGTLVAPGLTLVASPGISISNVTMDDRYNRAKVRVVQSISWPVGLSKLSQFVDRRDRGFDG
jgi:hypothetical protein